MPQNTQTIVMHQTAALSFESPTGAGRRRGCVAEEKVHCFISGGADPSCRSLLAAAAFMTLP